MRLLECFVALVALTAAPVASAGTIVVNHDEWPTTDTGFGLAGSGPAGTYVQNLADFLAGGGPGNFLVYSNNFAYGTNFQNTLTNAGHTVTLNNSLTFTAANLAIYDAVFLGGFEGGYNTAEAINYVNAGGGVYVAGGTADGFNAATEAAFWNPLLNNFGLQYASSYNGVGGVQPVSGSHPILSGVSQLYYNNGNTVSLFGANPSASIILTHTGGQGLIGVYSDSTAPVPEPSAVVLLTSGLAMLLLRRRRGARSLS